MSLFRPFSAITAEEKAEMAKSKADLNLGSKDSRESAIQQLEQDIKFHKRNKTKGISKDDIEAAEQKIKDLRSGKNTSYNSVFNITDVLPSK